VSTDLDERLKERDNFKFLTEDERFPSFGEEYSFIVLADIHIENEKTFGFEKLSSIMEGIKFVVVAGDITQYGDEKDIIKFLEIARSLGVPCYPVIGNHELYFGNWSVWKKYIGSTNYKIDGDTTTLFILDSANSFFGEDQLKWLEKEIKHSRGNIFVFTHANLFINGIEIYQTVDIKERARIVSILKNKADIMFMGHSHLRSTEKAGNVTYINIDDFKSTQTYLVVHVRKSGISYEFKKL
jgi:predicted phosphodiesterase